MTFPVPIAPPVVGPLAGTILTGRANDVASAARGAVGTAASTITGRLDSLRDLAGATEKAWIATQVFIASLIFIILGIVILLRTPISKVAPGAVGAVTKAIS